MFGVRIKPFPIKNIIKYERNEKMQSFLIHFHLSQRLWNVFLKKKKPDRLYLPNRYKTAPQKEVSLVSLSITCFNDVIVLIEDFFNDIWINVNVVVLDQLLQTIVIKEHSVFIIISKTVGHNSNLMAVQKFFLPYPWAKMICFYQMLHLSRKQAKSTKFWAKRTLFICCNPISFKSRSAILPQGFLNDETTA